MKYTMEIVDALRVDEALDPVTYVMHKYYQRHLNPLLICSECGEIRGKHDARGCPRETLGDE